MAGTTDSLVVEATLTLQGVWLHDPYSADTQAATAKQFKYGRSTRSTSIDLSSAQLIYAGRVYPVTEFGENQNDTYSVKLILPHGPTWASDVAAMEVFAQYRKTLCFRDNRGRKVFGTLSGYQEDDLDEGTSVAFTFTRVDYTESVA